MAAWMQLPPDVVLGYGDCRGALREIPDAYVDSCVTDPPYGLSEEPDAAEVMRHWIAGDVYEHGSQGFMGRTWDSFVPGPEYWREVYRVLKPGAYLLAFSSTRTWDLLSLAIRFAGFENRDTIGCPTLAWVQGQGFPKSKKTALKPAWEVVLVFRRPLVGTVVANVATYGTGALNIDGCRVRTAEVVTNHARSEEASASKGIYGSSRAQETYRADGQALGRYPPNLALIHTEDCRRVGTRQVPANGSIDENTTAAASRRTDTKTVYGDDDRERGAWEPYGNGDGTETVEAWECAEGCPVAEMDRQSGELTSGRLDRARIVAENQTYGTRPAKLSGIYLPNTGGASRYFYQAKASGEDRWFLCKLCGTAHPRRDRTEHAHGREDREHVVQHPTTKPTDLMRWLCRLVTPRGGTVLDPFMGTASTGVAALREGLKFIGVDSDPDYCVVARTRVERELGRAPAAATQVAAR